jgi:capsular exopolysaccharide synthesis family protein
MTPQQPISPAPGPMQGTSLVDRVNLAMHLRRYLKILARRWIIFTVCVLGGVGYMAYKAYSLPDMYRAVTTIGVAPRLRTFATQIEYQEALDSFYDENLNLLRGLVHERAEAKWARENPLTPSPARAIQAIKVASSFQIAVDATNLPAAQKYLHIWAMEFVAYKNEIKDNTIEREEARTADEITRFTHKLEEARGAKASFLRTNNIGSPQETGAAAQKRYDEATDRLQQIQTTLKLEKQRTPKDIAEGATMTARQPGGAKETVKDGNEADADPLARFAGESKYSDLKLRLLAEQSEFDRLKTTLKTNHPYMKLAAGRIQQLQEGLEHQLDLIKEKREAHIKSLENQEASFLALKQELLKEVQATRAIQYEYERLLKDEDTIEKHLEGLQKAMLAFDKSAIDQSQFSVVREGIPDRSPFTPERRKMILQGLFFGLVCGLGLVYFLHRMDDRLELASEIEEALEEPVLGQIPQIEMRSMKGKCILITNLDQYSFFAEAIRGVRSAVMLGTQGSKKQVLLVSSAVPGDGKTTFTVNFAATLALAGHNVLLVDADLRRGTAHNYFKTERQPGLSEILAGEEHWSDVLKETPIKSLHTINSGRLPANPGELLQSPIVKQFVTEAREAYDFVVIDCPPLTAIDDAFSLVGLSDGLLFVVRAGQTSMRFAKAALAAVRQRGCNILGIVLNGITADNPYYYYNTYYHSYYTKTAAESGGQLSSATPGARMAERKGRPHPASIVAEAAAVASIEDEATKAERYRQLKAARKRTNEPNGNGDQRHES